MLSLQSEYILTRRLRADKLKCATMRSGEKRRVLLSCVIPKTVTVKIYSGSPEESQRLRRALNPANTIAWDFPTRRGKDSTTCFPALFGNCTAKPAYFTSGIVHDVTRANSPRRQLLQFTSILFSSIRSQKKGLRVTDPSSCMPCDKFRYPRDNTRGEHVSVSAWSLREKVHARCDTENSSRKTAHISAVSTEIRKFHRSFMRVKISRAKVTVAR